MTFGTDADISNLCQFGWYEWAYFREDSASFPFQKEQLGRCLDPAKNEGNEMAQWVLKDSGKVLPRRTLRRLSTAELLLTNEVIRSRSLQLLLQIQWMNIGSWNHMRMKFSPPLPSLKLILLMQLGSRLWHIR